MVTLNTRHSPSSNVVGLSGTSIPTTDRPVAASRPWMGGRWLSESQLFGRPLYGRPDEWEHLSEFMLPLLTSLTGILNYSLIYGKDYAIDRAAPLPGSPIVDLAAVEEMDRIYLAMFDQERVAIERWEPNGLEIAIPATCWYAKDKFDILTEKTKHWGLKIMAKKGNFGDSGKFLELLAVAVAGGTTIKTAARRCICFLTHAYHLSRTDEFRLNLGGTPMFPTFQILTVQS